MNTIADFLFHHVILPADLDEMTNRGVKFEIEAKLGTLVDKQNNMRVRLPVESECILSEGLAFRSSMTEVRNGMITNPPCLGFVC